MKVIVSVTTTKARLGLFFYALQSLKRQNYNNFQISINLSKEPYLFDDGIDVVPDWMIGDNVQINFVNNSGSYRKLVPLIEQVGEDDIIVTADDDVLYAEDWLNKIIERTLRYQNYIVCGRARRIQKNILGRFQNYSHWPMVLEKTIGLTLLPIGCSGIAYRIKLLDLQFITNEAYLEYAPTADDIWFRLASIRKNTKVYVDPEIDEGNAYIRHNAGLEQMNLHRPKKRRRLHERAIIRLATKFSNYFGISLAKNDLAWKHSLEYSNLRSEGANSKRRIL